MTSRKPSWPERLGCLLAALSLLAFSPVEASPQKKPSSVKKAAKAKHNKARAPAKPASPAARAESGGDESETLIAETRPREEGESALHGAASFYGRGFHGRRAASGERFDAAGMTAASNRFPLGTWVAVRHLGNDRCVVVRINDRMHARHRVRIIDLSRGAAEKLRMIKAGVVLVRVARLREAPGANQDEVCSRAFSMAEKAACAECDPPESLVIPDGPSIPDEAAVERLPNVSQP